jgi:5'-nucleotidase / UDP-sugar diphosphatase
MDRGGIPTRIRGVLLAGLALVATPSGAASAKPPVTVRILHFSDYHSPALPFFAEGQAGVGGLARALAFLGPLAKEPRTLVFSGGDMLNRGTPAWSDRYGCTEWPWFDGIVSAMALGNHDSDYGPEAFARCRASVRYPILCANAYLPSGELLLPPYTVLERSGLRIGVFAVAGPDFERLVRTESRPAPGVRFGDRIEAARRVVKTLREKERVAAVVLIGHEQHEDDVELASKVPGIDLVLGTHSHLTAGLERIPGTSAWTLSPSQYLSHVSLVELTFRGGRLERVTGELVRMGPDRTEEPEIARRVAAMESELKGDPAYAPLFVRVGSLERALPTDGGLTGTSPLGRFVAEAMRSAAGAHVALTTASSVREPLPPGEIVEEQLRTTLPYPNRILVYELSGALLLRLLEASVSRSGTDLFAQLSGASYRVADGKPVDVRLLADPASPSSGESPIAPGATYHVATTDFLALTVEPYRTLLAGATPVETGLSVRDEVRRALSRTEK